MKLEQIKKSRQARWQKMLGLSVASELYGTAFKTPKVIVNLGTESYNSTVSIVLGMNHPAHDWCKDEIDLYESLDYVKGHEVQHTKSTTRKAWEHALQRGTEVVIEELCKEKGIHCRLSTNRDYEEACNKLSDNGLILSVPVIKNFVHFITNAIEDGRIEAIRASENAVFKQQVIHIRLLGWKMHGITAKEGVPYENLDSVGRLGMVLNQVLSLATESVFQKGFAERYFGTPLEDKVRECIPHIAKGVTAKKCRDMAEEAIEVVRILALWIGEASMRPEFSKQIQWIKTTLAELGLDDDAAFANEQNEDEGNGESTPFSNSDLYVILPDDEYDKLMEKMKDKENDSDSGSTMHVRREHPKEEEENEQSNDEGDGSSGSEGQGSQGQSQETEGSSSSGSSDSQNGQESSSNGEGNPDNSQQGAEGKSDNDSSSSSEGDSGESSKDGNSGKEDDGTSSGSSSDNSMASDDDSTVGNESAESNSDNSNSSGEQSDGQPQGQSQKGDKSGVDHGGEGQDSSQGGSSGDESSIEEEIEKQMKEAAEAAAGMAQSESEFQEKTLNRQEKSQDMAMDQKEPLTKTSKETVDAINSALGNTGYRLKEMERAYEVDTLIDPALMNEIQTFQRTLESLMKSKKFKTRRGLMSGKLDSMRTAMLAAGEVNVFKEMKESKGTSACAELILDNSGSMGYGAGSKREAACKALAKIEMGFAKYFPIKMLAFDASGDYVIHEIIKNWKERFSRSAAWNFLEKGRYGSSNNDSFSIRVAMEDLSKRPERRKLLVVLSDGAPCYGGAEDVKAAVREARRRGITVVGIYFTDPEYGYDDSELFKEMYEKDYIICEPNEITSNLARVLKKFFL